jgi:hypothetical protein
MSPPTREFISFIALWFFILCICSIILRNLDVPNDLGASIITCLLIGGYYGFKLLRHKIKLKFERPVEHYAIGAFCVMLLLLMFSPAQQGSFDRSDKDARDALWRLTETAQAKQAYCNAHPGAC